MVDQSFLFLKDLVEQDLVYLVDLLLQRMVDKDSVCLVDLILLRMLVYQMALISEMDLLYGASLP